VADDADLEPDDDTDDVNVLAARIVRQATEERPDLAADEEAEDEA